MTAGAGWLQTRWVRLNGANRIAGVDLARGLAIIGMFAAHLLWIDDPFAISDPSSWWAIVNGRSSILFATLAGVSIALVTGGPTPLTGRSRRDAQLRLVVRGLLLGLLGLVLIFTGVPVYVILPAYALLFLVAVPLVPLSARALLPLAAVLAVVMPFAQVWLDALPVWRAPYGGDLSLVIGWHYPFTTWIAFVVAGMGVARADIRRTSTQVWMLVIGVSLAVVGYGVNALSGVEEAWEPASFWNSLWTARAHSTGLLEVIGSGGFALATIAASLLVCRTVVVWVVLPLRALGSMPLSAYTAQIVVWVIVAGLVLGDPGDLAGFRDLEPFWPLTLGTILVCTGWALLIGRGPLEWAFDRIVRLTVPARRAGADADQLDPVGQRVVGRLDQ